MSKRYLIYNTAQSEYQFPSIYANNAKGAETMLFRAIRNDARKYRFEIRELDEEKAIQIRENMRLRDKVRKLRWMLGKASDDVLRELILKYGS